MRGGVREGKRQGVVLGEGREGWKRDNFGIK
jgi:hypothetical protein